MACQAINAWFDANEGINLLDCNIECCSGDNCNNHNLTLHTLTTTAASMNSNATGAGTSKSPTTVANGNDKQTWHAAWGNKISISREEGKRRGEEGGKGGGFDLANNPGTNL